MMSCVLGLLVKIVIILQEASKPYKLSVSMGRCYNVRRGLVGCDQSSETTRVPPVEGQHPFRVGEEITNQRVVHPHRRVAIDRDELQGPQELNQMFSLRTP